MKLRTLSLLAAVLLAGGAQAVTFAWDDTTMTMESGVDEDLRFSAGTDFSVALVFSNENNILDKDLKVLQVSNKRAGSYKNGGSFLEVKTDGSVYNRGKGGNYQEASISFDGLPQGENVIAFTADYTALTNGKWQLVYSVYLNGDLVNTYTDVDASGINYVRTGLGDSTLYYGEGLAAPSDMVILLPEPTALALLALGVAGVALRRRV